MFHARQLVAHVADDADLLVARRAGRQVLLHLRLIGQVRAAPLDETLRRRMELIARGRLAGGAQGEEGVDRREQAVEALALLERRCGVARAAEVVLALHGLALGRVAV
jgi:hypothetical protein